MSDDIAIKVEDVHKSFKLPHEKTTSIKSLVINPFKKRTYEKQRVLKGVSFEIKKGEFFGIVGRNGSGKSTLLKLLAGIYVPDKGSIQVNGKLTPFIELGVGFNPDLTGRENVYLNGALFGFSHKEMESMYDEIVEFAELERFMDQKLKNYSSGMQVRLAFSIAIRVQSDILVLDEVLAVGDEAFQRKCEKYFDRVKDSNKTVVLVTHSMESVRKHCTKAMMIKDGQIIAMGNPDDIANEYSLENLENKRNSLKNEKHTFIRDFKVELLSSRQISQKEQVRIKVKYHTNKTMNQYIVVGLQHIDRKVRLYTKYGTLMKVKKNQLVSQSFNFNVSKLNDANIKVMVAVYDHEDQILIYNEDHNSPKFLLRRNDLDPVARKRATSLFVNEDEHTNE